MAPHEGLVHPKEYDWRDSNVELIGSDIDHKVKYHSAQSEPAWNDGQVGVAAGLYIWRIENFEVVPWPKEKYGKFHEGDSYIVLHSYKVGDADADADADGEEQKQKLGHDVFFWLGSKSSQDEVGTAAYKTVELDEFLHGTATQHREIQVDPSDDFVALFPRITILAGGVASGFNHVDLDEEAPEVRMLLRIFKHPTARRADSVMVHEVPCTWESLDEDDVFVYETAEKIYVWQGKNCSPMEKAKAAQVVHDMTVAKHNDVEVVAQAESRSAAIVAMLGGDETHDEFHCERPMHSARKGGRRAPPRPRSLYRLSDASGELTFGKVKEGGASKADLDSNDVFLLDSGAQIWVWQGSGASKAEKAAWLRVAQKYVQRFVADAGADGDAFAAPVGKVVEGYESPAFFRALEV